ncbi:DUF5018 domain-containing protein [Chitinophaga oryzae]|uniref:DUF5018 domain-containing protein n=1 Tax=Chitinophaga oryzae TaxID=2725414 RepID=A0AAE6ZD89_9BACT|nr:DUF5018 domain-containing protein [Chitinophaga oryzae]QJB30626.1 DUF5018 domain-containing protein [Chitinophaga oryzae]QJB37126.1 DUF5018 domain-containing protein [Chitinophaga oryzae]
MKPVQYIGFLFCLLVAACHKPDAPSNSNDSRIRSIYVKFAGTDKQYPGVISDGKISFDVPIYLPGTDSLISTDLSKMEIVASIPVGATVTPGLTGIKDLSAPMLVTVAAANGARQQYTLTARKTGMNYTKGLLEFAVYKEGQTKVYQSAKAAPYNDGDTLFIDVPDTPKDPLNITRLLTKVKLEPTCTMTPELKPDATTDFSRPLEIKVTDGIGTIRTHYIAIRPTKFVKARFREVWFKSVEELGLTRSNIRSLAVSADYFFIPEFNDWNTDGKLFVFSTADGRLAKKIDPPATFSSRVTTDDQGRFLVSTWNESGKGFILYRYNDIQSNPEQILNLVSWDDPQYIPAQLGVNKISITGNTKSGKAFMYTTMPDGKYYTWEFNNGVPISPRPAVIQFDPAKTGGTWDIAAVKRLTTDALSDICFSWYNEGAAETDGKGSRFEIKDAAGNYYRLNPANHPYKILAYDVFTVNNDRFVAMLAQGIRNNSEARMLVFEISDKTKLPLAVGDPGYTDLKLFQSAPLGITTDFSSGEVHVIVNGLHADIYVGTTAISSQAAANAGVRKFNMEYQVE